MEDKPLFPNADRTLRSHAEIVSWAILVVAEVRSKYGITDYEDFTCPYLKGLAVAVDKHRAKTDKDSD